MNFTRRTGIKVLVVLVVALGAGASSPTGTWRHRHRQCSQGRRTILRRSRFCPRRVTAARRLQINATLEAFEEADLFAKVSGYLSDVRVDIGDHVKAGQVLAVIEVPEMEQELAEAKAQLESKQSSLELARRQLD